MNENLIDRQELDIEVLRGAIQEEYAEVGLSKAKTKSRRADSNR